MVADILFVLATFFWCFKLEQRTLVMYAASVTLTAVIKYFWR